LPFIPPDEVVNKLTVSESLGQTAARFFKHLGARRMLFWIEAKPFPNVCESEFNIGPRAVNRRSVFVVGYRLVSFPCLFALPCDTLFFLHCDLTPLKEWASLASSSWPRTR